MKPVDVALALLTAVGLALSPVGQLGAAETEPLHHGKATVLSVDPKEVRILMTEEPRGTLVLSLNGETRIVDDMGNRMAAAALQPGDLVREQCLGLENGKFVAREIRVLRPAWMETASPEQ